MDFIKRRLSMGSDPEKEEKVENNNDTTTGNSLLESLSSKRATIWNDLTAKMKHEKTSPSETGSHVSTSEEKPNSFSLMDAVKQKLQKVKQHYENGQHDVEEHKVECAPLIDTTDVENVSAAGESDQATIGDSEITEPPAVSNGNAVTRRRRLGKQDSLTAEELYLDEVAAKAKVGLVPPAKDSAIVSPSTAVEEFKFTEEQQKKKLLKKKSAGKLKSTGELTLTVPNNNLINFDSMQNLSSAALSEAEVIVHHEDDGVFDYESSGEESSEPVYTEFAGKKCNSLDSLQSLDSCMYDEETKELREFAGKFVNNIFSDNSNSTEVKAKFGKYVQDGNFRLEFAKAVSEKRCTTKAVTEHTFYQLVQYFAVVLFECEEADDFTPAMILMNMCFTFYYEALRGGNVEKNYLSSYLRNQPIWQSMRYWNAAFYEAVQTERNRKPLTTNIEAISSTTEEAENGDAVAAEGKDVLEEELQDRKFQENIIFGQLGTFLHNMRAFGLDLEWCLEFLRKQSTIGNLGEEQTLMLRECVEMDNFGTN